ncbi:5720_t:CDS:1, partial [Acaulospora morrowiae]
MAFSRFSILHSNSLPNFRKNFGHVNSFAIRTSTKHTSAATSQETVKLSFDRYDPPEPHVKNEHITLLTIHGLF